MLDLEPFNKWKMILKIQLFLAIFENIWFIPSRTLNKQKQENLPELSRIEKDFRFTKVEWGGQEWRDLGRKLATTNSIAQRDLLGDNCQPPSDHSIDPPRQMRNQSGGLSDPKHREKLGTKSIGGFS